MKREHRKRPIVMPMNPDGITCIPGTIITDPFGSYTGLVPEGEDKPIQDADDL